MAAPDPVEEFAHRLARRDLPPPEEPLRFDRESVLQRLQAGVAAAGLMRYARGHYGVAELLYAYLSQARWTSRALAVKLGRADTWVTRAMRGLIELGYIDYARSATDGRQWEYYLTRSGEDWVQSLVRVPLPPVP